MLAGSLIHQITRLKWIPWLHLPATGSSVYPYVQHGVWYVINPPGDAHHHSERWTRDFLPFSKKIKVKNLAVGQMQVLALGLDPNPVLFSFFFLE